MAFSCQLCGRSIGSNSNFCPHCGYAHSEVEQEVQLGTKESLCPTCGHQNEEFAQFCSVCGQVLSPIKFEPPAQLQTKNPNPQPRRQKRRGVLPIFGVGLVLSVFGFFIFSFTGQPNSPIVILPDQELVEYASCDELNAVFPGGIGARGADNKGGYIDYEWIVNDEGYAANQALDSDGDRIACEAEVISYYLLSCQTKQRDFDQSYELATDIASWLAENPDVSAAEDVPFSRAPELRTGLASFHAEFLQLQLPGQSYFFMAAEAANLELLRSWSDVVNGNSSGNGVQTEEGFESARYWSGELQRILSLIEQNKDSIAPTCS